MASELKVDKIFNAGGDQDSGINLATNDTIKFDIATSTKATMASTGIVTIVGEGGTVTTNLQQGLAKAWINFNGSGTIAIRDSNNITSITDNGTGDYDITIANDMANANYATLFGGGEGGDANSGGRIPNLAVQSASVMDVYCRNLDNQAADGAVQNLGFFGDLS